MVQGIQLWFDQIGGKLADRPVQLLIEDDQYSSTMAINKIRKLVEEDKVQVLAGTIASNIAYIIAPFVDTLQIPMIFPITGADDLTKRKRFKWVIRTGFSSSQYGLPFGEWVYNKLGYRRVAAFGLDYALGWELTGSFQMTFEKAGGQVLQKIWSPQGYVDFSANMRRLRSDVDAIFFCTSNSVADIVTRQYRELGPKLPMIGGGPSFDESSLEQVKEDALGAISVSHYSAVLNTPANQRFAKSFKEKYGPDAATSLFSEGAYTSGLWIQKAIEMLNGEIDHPVELLGALRKVNLADAPRGPMQLDDYGNPIQNIYIRRIDTVDGKLQNTVIDTIEKVSQFWTIDPIRFMREPIFDRDTPPVSVP
jgi:branched-chain amino acid transport system substrate-binding protein